MTARDTLNSLPDGFGSVDREWRVTFVNPAAEKILGLSRGQCLGARLWDLFPDLESTELGSAYLKAMQERTVQEVESGYGPLNLWLRVRAFPTREGIAISFADARPEREAREQLLRLHAELEARVQERTAQLERSWAETQLAHNFLDQVIENIPDALFVKDAQSGRFVRVNRALEKLAGRRRVELIGRSDAEMFPEDAESYRAKDRDILASGDTEGFDELMHTPHGLRTLHTRKLVIYDESNAPRFLLGISRDVTETKEREAEILRLNEELRQRTAEADAANRAKSTFLATMSHEIRTPMNGMLGMLELLSLTRLDEEQRANLETIRESSASLLRIVDDVLDFSKIEAGQLEIDPEPGSIPQILKEVERTYASAAARKGLKMRSLADPKISPVLDLDALRLRQILGNFVSNAVKFTHQGSVEIVAETAGRHGGLEQVRFLVRDTGIGISPENQRRLFQPFSQGDAEAARRAGGTGLGLSICRRLAEMMGGSVEMASDLGRGTTMALNLALPIVSDDVVPKAAAPAEREAVAPAAHHRRSAPGVAQAEQEGTLALLVDDHPTNRMLLQLQLQTLGYTAETAEDGERALRMWQSGRYGIIITDCEMPGLDGYQLAQAIRAAERAQGGRRTPVLACTAHALAGVADKCLAAGMDDCLVKPIDLRALERRLQQWLPLPRPNAPADAAGEMPLDLAVVHGTWGGDSDTLREILGFFQRANTDDAATLRSAIAATDLPLATRVTHRMLGASKMVGAHDFAQACERVHNATRAGDRAALEAALPSLEDEWQRLNAYIDAKTRAE